MNAALVEKVVNAVLYEGYILYPYRASSKKNRRALYFWPRLSGGLQPSRKRAPSRARCRPNVSSATSRKTRCSASACAFSIRWRATSARLPAPLTSGTPPAEPPRFEVVPDSRSENNFTKPGRKSTERRGEAAAAAVARSAAQLTHRIRFSKQRARSNRFKRRRRKNDRLFSCGGRRRFSGVVEVRAQPVDDAVFKISRPHSESHPGPA